MKNYLLKAFPVLLLVVSTILSQPSFSMDLIEGEGIANWRDPDFNKDYSRYLSLAEYRKILPKGMLFNHSDFFLMNEYASKTKDWTEDDTKQALTDLATMHALAGVENSHRFEGLYTTFDAKLWTYGILKHSGVLKEDFYALIAQQRDFYRKRSNLLKEKIDKVWNQDHSGKTTKVQTHLRRLDFLFDLRQLKIKSAYDLRHCQNDIEPEDITKAYNTIINSGDNIYLADEVMHRDYLFLLVQVAGQKGVPVKSFEEFYPEVANKEFIKKLSPEEKLNIAYAGLLLTKNSILGMTSSEKEAILKALADTLDVSNKIENISDLIYYALRYFPHEKEFTSKDYCELISILDRTTSQFYAYDGYQLLQYFSLDFYKSLCIKNKGEIFSLTNYLRSLNQKKEILDVVKLSHCKNENDYAQKLSKFFQYLQIVYNYTYFVVSSDFLNEAGQPTITTEDIIILLKSLNNHFKCEPLSSDLPWTIAFELIPDKFPEDKVDVKKTLEWIQAFPVFTTKDYFDFNVLLNEFFLSFADKYTPKHNPSGHDTDTPDFFIYFLKRVKNSKATIQEYFDFARDEIKSVLLYSKDKIGQQGLIQLVKLFSEAKEKNLSVEMYTAFKNKIIQALQDGEGLWQVNFS